MRPLVLEENNACVACVSGSEVESMRCIVGLHGGGNPWIHDIEPQRREETEQNRGRVPQRKLRALLVAIKRLVLFGRLEMVIAVTGQFIQGDAPNIEVRIPGVMRLDAFIPARRCFHSPQSIVLDVIDAF